MPEKKYIKKQKYDAVNHIQERRVMKEKSFLKDQLVIQEMFFLSFNLPVHKFRLPKDLLPW